MTRRPSIPMAPPSRGMRQDGNTGRATRSGRHRRDRQAGHRVPRQDDPAGLREGVPAQPRHRLQQPVQIAAHSRDPVAMTTG
ncbi:hypothetical protein AB0K16_23045 [Nonomuraea jabiensis]|uniref:hypothetical protein n=1 Tax=Nonomuraea jabiensis TaxID=882448 RepID=UPI00341375AE